MNRVTVREYLRTIQRGLTMSRCVVDFWCGLVKMGAEITVSLQGRTGELALVTALGTTSHQSRMPAIRLQFASRVKPGEEISDLFF